MAFFLEKTAPNRIGFLLKFSNKKFNFGTASVGTQGRQSSAILNAMQSIADLFRSCFQTKKKEIGDT